jgi:hypothetical protein
MKRAHVCGIFLSLASWPVLTTAQTGWGAGSWQAIGATGTPDEVAASRVLLQDNGWAEIRPEIPSSSVKLRYNIPPLEGLRGSDDVFYTAYELRAQLRDNGPAARVLVTVKSMAWGDGRVRTLTQLDSNRGAPTSDTGDLVWGGYLRDETGFMKYFRPFHHAYWAEVQLIRTAPEGRPAIRALAVLIGP